MFAVNSRCKPLDGEKVINWKAQIQHSWLLNKILCDLQKKGNTKKNYQRLLQRSNLHVFI